MSSARDIQNHTPQLWGMSYVYTLTASLLINISSFILITVLPLYTLSIGGSNSIAGLLTTLLTLSALMFRPFFGKMLDTTGRRIVLMLGLCLFSFSTILLVTSTNILLLLGLRFFQGIGLSAYSTALGTILADVVPAPRISEGVGYFGISQTLAMAGGPVLGLYLCARFGYQTTYLIAFGIGVFSIVLASLINYERTLKHRIENNHEKRTAVRETSSVMSQQNRSETSFLEKSSVRPCIVLLFVVFAVSAVFSFMPIFSKARDIEHIGLFFTCYAVSMILTRLITGRLADHYGFSKVLLPGIAMMFMLFLTLAFAYSLPVVLLAAIFYGVGFGTVQPILNAIVIRLSPPERRGAANATYYATMDIGYGLGSLVWGVVSQMTGFTVVFLGCASCIVASTLAYYLLLHRLPEKRG